MFFLSNLCFLCLNTNNLKPVLIENNDQMLIDKVSYCLPELDVDFNFEIAKYICSNCINNLECLYKFKQTCLRNNTYLKSYLQTLTSTGQSHKHLSVKLNDIKYQNKLSPVSSDETFTTAGTDDEQHIAEKENLEADIKYEIDESHSLFEEENDIVVKEEYHTFENKECDEFYHALVTEIKRDSISSDSDVSVSRIEDVLHEKSKYCDTGTNSKNNLTKPKENKITGKNEGSKIFQCAMCTKKYLCEASFRLHLKAHASKNDFSCSMSKRPLKFKNSLTKHENTKTFDCTICKKKFTQKGYLIRHEKIHKGIKNYECSICKNKFMNRSTLVQHEKIHSGIRNFQCSICEKKFIQKRDMTLHETSHTGVKSFQCSVCEKKFMRKRTLKLHEGMHTGTKFQCSVCKKYCLQKSDLIKHEKIHTRIKK